MSEFSPVIATTQDNLHSTEILVRNYTPLDVKHSELRSIGRAEIDVVHNERVRNASTFVIKEYPNNALMQHHLNHYQYLRDHGFPLPPTVRTVGENNLLVTDLTENGANELFVLDSDKNYRNFHIANRTDLKNQMLQIAQKADQLGIRLSADAFYIVLDPQGNGHIVIGDFGAGVKITPEELNEESHYQNTAEAASGFWDVINANFTEGGYFPIQDPLYEKGE